MTDTTRDSLYKSYKAVDHAELILRDLRGRARILAPGETFFGYPRMSVTGDPALPYAIATRALELSRGDIDRAFALLAGMRETLTRALFVARHSAMPASSYAAEALALQLTPTSEPMWRRISRERGELTRQLAAWEPFWGIYVASWYLEKDLRRYDLKIPMIDSKGD